VQLARLTEGGPFDLHTPPDENEPHVDLKPNASQFPEIDRSHKGDPVVAMRPSFDSRLQGGASATNGVAPADLAFRVFGASTQVMLAPRAALPGDEESQEFAAPGAAMQTTTQRGAAAALPAQAGSISTPASLEAARERVAHGATLRFRAPSRSAPRRRRSPTPCRSRSPPSRARRWRCRTRPARTIRGTRLARITLR